MSLDQLKELFDIVVSGVLAFSDHFPLPAFVFIGALLEDLISAIPSAAVYGLAGSIANNNNYNIFQIVFLVLFACLGKTIAAGFFYLLADKFEDHIPKRVRDFFGLNHEKVEEFGEKFSKGSRDEILIFALRAIPSSPSMTISFAAGFIKTKFSSFLIATFLGYIFPVSLYFAVGYFGVDAIGELFNW